MIEQHYTTAELAEKLACSPDTVLRLAQRGKIRSVRVGNDRRYPESAIREYLDAHTEGPPPVASLAQRRETRASQPRRTA